LPARRVDGLSHPPWRTSLRRCPPYALDRYAQARSPDFSPGYFCQHPFTGARDAHPALPSRSTSSLSTLPVPLPARIPDQGCTMRWITQPGWPGNLLAVAGGASTTLALAPFDIWP